MKIIEALKELPVLEKRMRENCGHLQNYSSIHSAETPAFETAEAQTEKVNSYLQANKDLADRYEWLKRSISLTNATVKVPIGDKNKTIVEWLAFKKTTFKLRESTQLSLTPDYAINRMNQVKPSVLDGVQVTRLYKEEAKLAALEKLHNEYNQINATLEIVNATMDLIEAKDQPSI